MKLFVLNSKIEKRSVTSLLQKFFCLNLFYNGKGREYSLFFGKNVKKIGKELFTGLSSSNQSARVSLAVSHVSLKWISLFGRNNAATEGE